MIVCLYPVFDDDVKLADHSARCAWYLGPLSSVVKSVHFPHAPGIKNGFPPSYLGKTSIQLAEKKVPIKFVPCPTRGEDIRAHLKKSDVILVWNEDFRDSLRDHLSKAELESKKIIRVDHEKVQYAGSFYLNIDQTLRGTDTASLQKYRERFFELFQFARSDISYIFGTGPNLGQLENYAFSDGVTIACHSVESGLNEFS